jgi:hypothetical protein
MAVDFKKHKYTVIKQAIDKDLAMFIYNYFLMKKQVYLTFKKHQYMSPFEDCFGTTNDPQIPNTYSHYCDIAMETLMLKLQPVMEKVTGLKLNPSYSYARIYKKGDTLYRHTDRFSCEISTTLRLGGDSWPIFLDPTGEKGIASGHDQTIKLKKNANKGIKVDLDIGDMLVYRGCDLEHWREPFKKKEAAQVFLHYNSKDTPYAEQNIFDARVHLGLPQWFKGRK